MKLLIFVCSLSLFVFHAIPEAWGLIIDAPKSGSIYYPDYEVVVKAKADVGENVEEVMFATTKMDHFVLDKQAPFEFNFKIDSDFMGMETIDVEAKLIDGTYVKTSVVISVQLPPNVVLKRISVDPTYVVLWKLPPGSNPNDVSIYETEDLGVGGLFSDGIKRGMTSSRDGTIYSSSNEEVVKIDAEGKITAQGVGAATITVKNGNFKAVVQAIVKSKNH